MKTGLVSVRPAVRALVVFAAFAGMHSISAQWLPASATSGPIYYTGGNVGIGTSAPVTTLQVSGSSWLGTFGTVQNGIQISDNQIAATGSNSLFINASEGGNVGIGTSEPPYELTVAPQGSGSGLAVGWNRNGDQGETDFYNYGQNDAGGFSFWNYSAPGTGYPTTAATNLLTVLSSGNVGIGTATPATALQIVGSSWLGTFGASSASVQISSNQIATSGSGALLVNASQGGNVGIGTLNPVHLLQVAGTVGAEEVIVSSTGADYVFDPAYRLDSLSNVEAYIAREHHLPDVPSAEEMKEKGLSVGEMQTMLLAKIEELTLHLIEANRRIEALAGR